MRLPALEKNILIYRALQMTLFLFYAESIRRQIVDSVGSALGRRDEIGLKGSRLLKRIFLKLETEGTLSVTESRELQRLLEHRNVIAHEIHLLTGDISLPKRNYRLREFMKLKYDYDALVKIKGWQGKIEKVLGGRYILTISLDWVFFEAAEQAYERELTALRKRIDRLYAIRLRKLKKPSSVQAAAGRS